MVQIFSDTINNNVYQDGTLNRSFFSMLKCFFKRKKKFPKNSKICCKQDFHKISISYLVIIPKYD